jgi:hypothetical protein
VQGVAERVKGGETGDLVVRAGKIAAEIMAYPLAEEADRVQPPCVIRVRARASRRRTWRADQWDLEWSSPRCRSPVGKLGAVVQRQGGAMRGREGNWCVGPECQRVKPGRQA